MTPLRDASTHCPQPLSGQTISPQTMQAIASKMGLSNQPGISEPDIFNSAIIRIDKREYRLMQYPFSAFIRISFLAEAMSPEPEIVSFEHFRHQKAITERLQRCAFDQLTLYTTLAYCANCLMWATGERAIPDRPAEYYTVKAIESLKTRLGQADPPPDSCSFYRSTP